MVRYLIVTADDFGYCGKRNQGIVEAFLAGGITRASVLVTAAAARQAAQLGAEHHIPLGLHFNVTEGYSVSDPNCVSSLLSNGAFKGKVGFRDAVKAGQINLEEVRLELQAQLAEFKKLTGHPPMYVDGHNHIHVLPGVCEVFAEVLYSSGVHRSRLPNELALATAADWLMPIQRMEFYRDVVREASTAGPVFSKHGIWFSDGFSGMATMGKDMTLERLESLLSVTFSSIENTDCFPVPASGDMTINCDMQNQRVGVGTLPVSASSCDVIRKSPAPDSDNHHHGVEHQCPKQTDPLCDMNEQVKDTTSQQEVHQRKVQKTVGSAVVAVELMVHPGYPCVDPDAGCGLGPDDFAKSEERLWELDIMKSQQWQAVCRQNHFNLCAQVPFRLAG